MKTNSLHWLNTTRVLFSALMMMLLFNVALGQDRDEKRLRLERSLLKPMDFDFQDQIVFDVFEKLSLNLRIQIIFHQSAVRLMTPSRINLKLENVSSANVIMVYLERNNLDYVEVDERTIMIVKKSATASNSKSLEDFVIRVNEIVDVDQNAVTDQLPRFRSTSVIFRENYLIDSIQKLADSGKIAVEFDERFKESIKHAKVRSFELRSTTYPRALKLLLDTYELKYSLIAPRTIKIGVNIANPSSIPLEEIMPPQEKKP
jgi:hypothetical protein